MDPDYNQDYCKLSGWVIRWMDEWMDNIDGATDRLTGEVAMLPSCTYSKQVKIGQ